jgi:hypothetical protein
MGNHFPILEYLLEITTDQTISVATKVLLFSPSTTPEAREFFAHYTILSMDAMHSTGGYPKNGGWYEN